MVTFRHTYIFRDIYCIDSDMPYIFGICSEIYVQKHSCSDIFYVAGICSGIVYTHIYLDIHIYTYSYIFRIYSEIYSDIYNLRRYT